MSGATIARWSLLGIVILSGGACWFAGGPGDVRRDVAQATDLQLHREFGMQVGRFGLFLARQGLRIADEPDITLDGVRRVEIGVYETRPRWRSRDTDARGNLCRTRLSDWDLVVRVCEGEEHVMLYVDQQDEAIRGMLVVVQEEDEVVIVRARGRLDLLLESVLELARDEFDEPLPWSRTARAPGRNAGTDTEPWLAVCETGGERESPDCVGPDEARERVLAVAGTLAPGEAVSLR